MTNARVFDALAPFYDQHWGPAFLDDATHLFEEFLGPKCAPQAHILDLCCGAGHFSAWLEARGFQVTGVDASALMIEYAGQKAVRSQFYQANMAGFHLPVVCDAVVCFYNSLNQALTMADLRATLQSVHAHLRPGGTFLFDFVAPEGYERTWGGDEFVTCDDRTCSVQYAYDREEQLAVCNISIRDHADSAVQDQPWRFFQRPLDLMSLLEELRAAGFRVEAVSGVDGAANPPDGRVVIAAVRISSSI